MSSLPKKIEVEDADVGKRLDIFLLEKFKDFSRSHITNLIKAGDVSVDGKIVLKCGFLLKAGAFVDVKFREIKKMSLEPEELDIDIIYEDEDIAVINKAQGMTVHPAGGSESGTLVNALLARLTHLSGINGVERPGIVHRLDKDTSGLLVVAKNDAAHISLQKQIQNKSARRIYVALVNGNIKTDGGTVCTKIGRSPKDRKLMAVTESGRDAVTNYKVLARNNKYTYVEFELKTGRTHQIRVHAKHIGHIIVGDTKYGDGGKLWRGQLLHAKTLILTHPKTNQIMEFNAPLPDYFARILNSILGE